MPESRTITGSRDDLVLDISRCLRMRFSESSCCHCVDICPHGAVTLDDGIFIDPEKCRGCLLCTSVCPIGALEQHNDFAACLIQLSRVAEPVLGCIRTKEHSNATMSCLGGLSEEHLLALHHSLAGRLTLNLSVCSDCPNHPMIAKLRQRLDALSAAKLSYSNCCIDIVESAHDINFQDESLDRRGFFKSFGKALFKSADIIISTTHEQSEVRAEYAAKRLPIRRKLLNSIRVNMSQELETRLRTHFDPFITVDENCTACQGCVAICPTGALNTAEADTSPVINHLLCTGCGLCQEFCLDSALKIHYDCIAQD